VPIPYTVLRSILTPFQSMGWISKKLEPMLDSSLNLHQTSPTLWHICMMSISKKIAPSFGLASPRILIHAPCFNPSKWYFSYLSQPLLQHPQMAKGFFYWNQVCDFSIVESSYNAWR
jgi:hypothetical protein